MPANCLTQRMSSDPAPNKNTKSLPYGTLSFHVYLVYASSVVVTAGFFLPFPSSRMETMTAMPRR